MTTALAFLPAVLWAAAVWVIGGLSSVPVSPPAIPGIDKLAHFTLYGVLGVLLGAGWARVGGGGALAVLLVGLALLLGAGDEVRQGGVATRSPEVADWLADGTGIVAGFLMAAHVARRQRR